MRDFWVFFPIGCIAMLIAGLMLGTNWGHDDIAASCDVIGKFYVQYAGKNFAYECKREDS